MIGGPVRRDHSEHPEGRPSGAEPCGNIQKDTHTHLLLSSFFSLLVASFVRGGGKLVLLGEIEPSPPFKNLTATQTLKP
ncbi:hypothetical protein L6452_26341 [Arctium lappa]|uniref:Uncharacterized protein n=1 Tax=Arctium lappa TaxID=4217 RepID=A0ACB9ACX4_ARCLA|nr:hypothetical protein L6452_26341 [Arctium lappa]